MLLDPQSRPGVTWVESFTFPNSKNPPPFATCGNSEVHKPRNNSSLAVGYDPRAVKATSISEEKGN